MNKKEIENTLKDYHWMINSIKIMRDSLKGAGEESAMPKPKGTTSEPVQREVLRRSKH